METETVLDKEKSGRRRTFEENFHCVRQAFGRFSTKSTSNATRHWQIPHCSIHKMLNKNLRLCVYKVETLHSIELNDKLRQKRFAIYETKHISETEAIFTRVCFVIRQFFLFQRNRIHIM